MLRPPEEQAVERILQALAAIKASAEATNVDGPGGSWAVFDAAAQEAAQAVLAPSATPKGADHTFVHSFLNPLGATQAI